MDISREELLKQKAMLEEQLQWVNRKLGEPDPAEATPSETAPATIETVAPAPTEEPLPDPGTAFLDAAQQYNAPESDDSAKRAAADQALENLVGKRAVNGGRLGNSEKLGCAAIAIGAIATILFILFVLPYLIY